jgi:DNA-3-methyladenine glycosylase II
VTRDQLRVRGAFDLEQSRAFLEGWPAGNPGTDEAGLRFTYCAPPDWQPTCVRVDAALRLEASVPVTAVLRDDVARILSVDVDGAPLDDIAAADPVVAGLVRRAPGLRPVCFWSTWEAACWAVLSQRTSMRATSLLKQRITEAVGPRVAFCGVKEAAFPSPPMVLDAPSLPGVNPVKFARIQGIARAAEDGELDAGLLRSLPAGEALERLQALPGIGPFSATLILIRGAGAPDVFTLNEPRVLERMQAAYGVGAGSDLAGIAEGWRPLRSWVAFLLRAA